MRGIIPASEMTFYREATFGVIDPVITGSKSLECFSPDHRTVLRFPKLSHTVEFVGVSFVELWFLVI